MVSDREIRRVAWAMQVLLCLSILWVPSIRLPAGEVLAVEQQSPRASGTEETKRRESTATAGVLLLMGVLAVGLLTIAGTLVGGAKLRRLVRQPLREPIREDELWYLRQQSADPDPIATAPHDAPESAGGDHSPPMRTDDSNQ